MSTSEIAKSGIGRLALGAAAGTALAALLAGCASSSSSGSSPAGAASSTAAGTAAGGSVSGLKTRSTSIGTVLVDPSGHTVYELVGDTAAHQTCSAGCLAIWPMVKTNGSQTIVNGHPAFTFAGDTAPGQTKGQNLTDQWGRWLALDASGNPINASPAPTSTSKAPSGGGPAF